ncbi:tetratricopeptide (TPR) repeat protein [Dysgonomonas sp. PH5-45]|uniref:tetratricopeptide repeat protein n=1 Tax=unclassified Dysgonomonas TaxID=2630389 RepID=UPI002474BF94|nr:MULTISPECIES: tetratricopeptide repeat protein [unclassified Dysgonomonas]MDH6355090.1 tetratricopeptide (TPR) repeat protein [Dysgonomonas sp. PH5-45]MDH6387990.1 tetratricopeptide (TPR) repeat protein [Dysgonomonas sp. PH5-37]
MRNLLLYLLFSLSFVPSAAQVIDTDKVMAIGRNALYYEDYVLSIQYFNQVIKAKPYLADPYYFRAVAKYLLEDFEGAEYDCTECVNRNPFVANAYYLRGDCRLNNGNYDGAIEDYNKSLGMIPDNKFVQINLGIAYIQKKQYAEAEKQLDVLVEKYPTYTPGLLTRGSLYLEQGDTIKALNDYNKAIAGDLFNSQGYSMRGLLYSHQKEYDKALADFDEAIKLEPFSLGNYINRGLVKYHKNDFRGAMADYDKVVDLDGANIIGRFNRGLLRAQVGDDNNAIADFDVVLKAEPNNHIAYYNRALLKVSTADYRGAIDDMNKVLAEYPDFYHGFYARSEIKSKMRDQQGAEKDFRYARNLEARITKEIMSGKGQKDDEDKTREKSDKSIDKFNLLMVADKTEEQKSKYKSSARGRVQDKQVNLELEPIFVATYYEKTSEVKSFVHFNNEINELNKKGVLFHKLKMTNAEGALTQNQIDMHFASIAEKSDAIENDKMNSILYFARGVDYMLVQDVANAISDMNKAVAVAPDFTLAYFNLGGLYAKQLTLKKNQGTNQTTFNGVTLPTPQGEPKEQPSKTAGDASMQKDIMEYGMAIGNYTKVIELSPDFVYAYYNRAGVRVMQSDYRSAILDYNEAIRRDPEFAEAYYNRGICRLHIADIDRGLADLRKAGELGIVSAYSIIKRMTKQ